MERRNGFKMGEDELTLLGTKQEVGMKAPDFDVVDRNLKKVTLAGFDGKIKIFSAVPSLDTSVCEMQTMQFNEEVGKLGDQVALMTISMDLPFAQARFCSSHQVENGIICSDYQQHSFATNYGCLINELKLCNRSIFVVDRDNKLIYVEYVEQNTNLPNLEAALEAVKKAL